jgi:hypothetical protein
MRHTLNIRKSVLHVLQNVEPFRALIFEPSEPVGVRFLEQRINIDAKKQRVFYLIAFQFKNTPGGGVDAAKFAKLGPLSYFVIARAEFPHDAP